jgi:hypothetical protein
MLSHLPFLVVPVAFVVGCAAPDAAPLDDAVLAASVRARAASPAELEAALVAADIAPLALPRPRLDAAAEDSDGPDFWRASAFAFDAETRAARRAFVAAAHRSGSAGLPGALALEAEHVGFDEADRETEIALSFDVLGILGLGRSHAAGLLAAAEERMALGSLERAAYAARFRVDRAHLALSAARATSAALERLIAEDAEDLPRRDRLVAAGRIAPGDAAMDVSVRRRLEARLAEARADEASARADLARAAGLPPDHPALARVTPAPLEAEAARVTAEHVLPHVDEDGAALLRRRPDLRERKLDYAVREARVRSAAAERIPELRLGPKFAILPDSVLAGGVASIDLTWPGAADGEVAAALEERTAAREATEDALVVARTEVASARERVAAHRLVLIGMSAADAASADAWRAARARFRLETDPLSIVMRAQAWEARTETAVERISAAAACGTARLDFEEAGGDEVRP